MSETELNAIFVAPPQRGPLAMALKRALQFAFLVLCVPWFIGYGIGRLVWGRDRAFLLIGEHLALVPGMIGVYLRQAFFERMLARCGADCYFGWLSTFSMPQAEIGANVYVGRNC